jgi:hypothetical protein
MDKLYQSDASFSECKVYPEKKVAIRHVVNTINYCNFQEKAILVIFRHKKYQSTITLEVVPQPCKHETFECAWTCPQTVSKLRFCEFSNIIIDDEKRFIYCKPAIKKVMDNGFVFSLEDEYYFEVPSARVTHHPVEGIVAEVAQHGIKFSGTLLQFSGDLFKLQIGPESEISHKFLNLETSVLLTLSRSGRVIYSEECVISECSPGQQSRTFILKPLASNISRLNKKRHRSRRVEMPFLSTSYINPVTDKTRTFKIRDISGSGISIEQFQHNSDLIPGMILPSVKIHFANFSIACMAQVLYKNIVSTDENTVRCGLVFLNMEIRDQANLAAILYQRHDTKTYIRTTIDLDRLWKFFFDSGFIYPQKYALMHERKDMFKDLYEKLYNRNNDIARYFIYQDKGEIYAHVAMIRAYENTWLIHHHASNRLSLKAGFEVLGHVAQYINDFHALFATHMHYVMCYYRPDNKYPHRVFGGCAAQVNNSQAISLDAFAYLNISAKRAAAEPRTFGLQISPASSEDIDDLISFYTSISGGLALSALNLAPACEEDSLGRCYEKNGLQRTSRPFSIKHDDTLQAIALVNTSEAGLNFSNLTHCIHLFICNESHLQREALFSVLASLSGHYHDVEEVTVLLYPAVYAEQHNIEIEKIYNLWVLSMDYTDLYYDYVNELFKPRRVRDKQQLSII